MEFWETYATFAAPRMPNLMAFSVLGGSGGFELFQFRRSMPRAEAISKMNVYEWQAYRFARKQVVAKEKSVTGKQTVGCCWRCYVTHTEAGAQTTSKPHVCTS